MSDFGENTYPIARKAYRCECCFGPILMKEKHVHYKGRFDGEWSNYRLHNECLDALTEDGYSYEFTPGEGDMPERIKMIIETENNRLLQAERKCI